MTVLDICFGRVRGEIYCMVNQEVDCGFFENSRGGFLSFGSHAMCARTENGDPRDCYEHLHFLNPDQLERLAKDDFDLSVDSQLCWPK